MPQLKTTPLGNNPADKTPGAKAMAGVLKGKWPVFIIATIVIAAILTTVFLSNYFSRR